MKEPIDYLWIAMFVLGAAVYISLVHIGWQFVGLLVFSGFVGLSTGHSVYVEDKYGDQDIDEPYRFIGTATLVFGLMYFGVLMIIFVLLSIL